MTDLFHYHHYPECLLFLQAVALSALDGQLPVLAAPTEAVSAYGMSKPKMQQVDRAMKDWRDL